MKIKLISVGKIKEKFFVEAIQEYAKRLSAYCDLQLVEVPDESISKNSNESLNAQIKIKEGQKILSKIKDQEYVICLDLHQSKSYDSVEFAYHLDKLMCEGKSQITFIIGGSLGIGENVLARANERMLLSKMTFTHQMAKIIILEQVYRAFKILNNESYHK